MKILMAHNFYKLAGGEDLCVAAEAALLRSHGHEVTSYCLSNDAVDGIGRLHLAQRTIWSRETVREMRRLIRAHRPEVVHFHNTFPLISPAAYYAAHAEGVPVVQTLHNFRLVCVNAVLLRDGRPCEACLGKAIPWRGVVHGCYRDDRAASAATAGMLVAHRLLGTWRREVDVYIAPSEFSRRKLIAGGLPAEKIAVKSNFVYPEPAAADGEEGYALYVGRLSQEKGVHTLLAAWRHLGNGLRLKIAGDGPLAAMVQDAAMRDPTIEWLHGVSHEQVYELMGRAGLLVLPSQCYEGALPRVVIESFAKGTPVVAPDHGAMADIVEGHNGVCFKAGDAHDLAAKVRDLCVDASALRQMRQAARATFERNFTAEANHDALMAIYSRAAGEYGRRHLTTASEAVA